SSAPPAKAISAMAATSMGPSASTSSRRTSPSQAGPTPKPPSRYTQRRASSARRASSPPTRTARRRRPTTRAARASSRPAAGARAPPEAPGPYSHLVLLARSRTGYEHLVKLSSIGFLEGFYRRPRIDREVLERYSGGLIGLAACLSGEIALYLRQGNYEAAKA